MIRTFDSDVIEVIIEGNKVLFNTDQVAYAASFSRTGSLDKHIKGTKYDVLAKNGKRYLTAEGIRYASTLATKTPILKRIADWAVKVKKEELAIHKAVKSTPKIVNILAKPPVLFGIRAAAELIGMTNKEFSDWLVDEGYAGRYVSNNNLFWKDWFKDQKYGTLPIIKDARGERQSNVPKITETGLMFVKNRITSQRQSNVLAFAKKEASESEKMEKEIDKLILDTFDGDFGLADFYEITETDLLKGVKSIIAQVKLKEKT